GRPVPSETSEVVSEPARDRPGDVPDQRLFRRREGGTVIAGWADAARGPLRQIRPGKPAVVQHRAHGVERLGTQVFVSHYLRRSVDCRHALERVGDVTVDQGPVPGPALDLLL